MSYFETALRLYRVIGGSGDDTEHELRKLAEIIRTRSQLVNDVEYLTISRLSKSEVRGYIVIRGRRDSVLNEVRLITTLVKSSFKTIDVEEVVEKDIYHTVIDGIKSFF